ncbi:MAG TPA: hypothetical protein VFZ58_02480 [Candidatus Saccharimonadales bacterium]
MDTESVKTPEDNLSRKNTTVKTPDTPPTSRPLSLFKHVTTLASGLIAVCLLSMSGYTLLDYWLSENNEVNYFSSYMYSFYLYLFCGLLFFTALHLWAHWRQRHISTDVSEPIGRTAHTFLVLFLVILTVTVVGNLVAVTYIAANTALGTADYSTKDLWKALLGPLQTGVWAALLCWYFKGASNGRRTVRYLVVASVISLTITGLLLAFPIIAKRNTVIDGRTSNDLSNISLTLNEFVNNNDKLPDTLTELELDDKVASRLSAYEYQKSATPASIEPTTSEKAADTINDLFRAPSEQFSYKLCADFKTDTSNKNERLPIPFLTTSSDFGTHPAGRHCFNKSAYGKSITGDQPVSSDGSGSSLERY